MKVLAEETTTMPEGAVVSVYRGQYEGGKVRSQFTELVAMHAGCPNKRVSMRVDDIPAHCLKTYLTLTMKAITRERLALTDKPKEQWRKPQTIKDFVLTMAYHGMFILGPWNETTNTKTVLEGSEQIPNETRSDGDTTQGKPVRKHGSGTGGGSGKAKANRRRRTRGDERVQPDAVRKVRKTAARPTEAGGCPEGLPEVVAGEQSRPGSDPVGNPARGVCETGDGGEGVADVGLSEEPPNDY